MASTFPTPYNRNRLAIQIILPWLPVLLAQFPIASATAVAMDAHHAFVAHGSNRIDVFTLDEPARPHSAAQLALGDRTSSRRLYADPRGALHLARGSSLTTFDTRNPLSLISTKTNALPPSGPVRISFSGAMAVGMANSLWLWTLDLADPQLPAVTGMLSSAPSLNGLVVDGNRGFGGGFNRLDWLDPSNPAQPAFVASFNTDEIYRSLAVHGNHLYVTTQEPGLQVFDVSAPQVFTLLTNLPVEGVGSLTLDGNRLYLNQAQQPRLAVYSLESPASPVRIGAYTNLVQFSQVLLHDGVLYGRIPDGGFEALDVSDLADIRRIGGNGIPITSLATAR